MQLDDFVFETIKQVVDGVARAKEYGKQKGARINPEEACVSLGDGMQAPALFESSTHRPIDRVEFDLAVTTTEGTQEKAGAGLFVATFGLGVQGQLKNESQSISRIRFSIPVLYP